MKCSVRKCGDFYFDGNEHHGGNDIDINRISKGGFRDYVSFPDNIDMCCQHWGSRNEEEKLLMNLVDNAVGAWSSIFNGNSTSKEFLYPLSEIHDRAKNGEIFTNPNGRWYKSISFSEFIIENNEPVFPDLFLSSKQQSLF